jgi:hypothetical protein
MATDERWEPTYAWSSDDAYFVAETVATQARAHYEPQIEALRARVAELESPPFQFAAVVGDELVIRTWANQLKASLRDDPDYEHWLVTDDRAFARDVVLELTREQDDGTTPIHLMLDECARAAVDNGSAFAIEEEDEDEDQDDD